ncbi:MAG: hypothetical protein IT303_11460 [Dehalococcoidia bacterium]|nr:hypothetical protein [Dehalococcoidia bacterium]
MDDLSHRLRVIAEMEGNAQERELVKIVAELLGAELSDDYDEDDRRPGERRFSILDDLPDEDEDDEDEQSGLDIVVVGIPVDDDGDPDAEPVLVRASLVDTLASIMGDQSFLGDDSAPEQEEIDLGIVMLLGSLLSARALIGDRPDEEPGPIIANALADVLDGLGHSTMATADQLEAESPAVAIGLHDVARSLDKLSKRARQLSRGPRRMIRK